MFCLLRDILCIGRYLNESRRLLKISLKPLMEGDGRTAPIRAVKHNNHGCLARAETSASTVEDGGKRKVHKGMNFVNIQTCILMKSRVLYNIETA